MASITEEQKETVTGWIAEYATLGEIQKRLKDELGVSVTYMETRFLLEDLGLEVQEKPQPKKPEPAEEMLEAMEEAGQESGIPEPDPIAPPAPGPEEGSGGLGRTSVTVDKIMRPGMMMSGRVVFADGEKAGWYVDQMGQMGLDVDTPGYRPSEENIRAFQKELRAVVEKR